MRDEVLPDATYDAILQRYADELAAAVRVVRVILAKFARDVDDDRGGGSSNRAQKTDHYRKLLTDLEREEATGVTAAAGPQLSTNLGPPAFVRGMDDIDGGRGSNE